MSFRRMFQHKKGVLPSLVAALLVPAMAHAFDPFVVRDIRVEGIQRTDAGTVFGYLPVKVGENSPMKKPPRRFAACTARAFL